MPTSTAIPKPMTWPGSFTAHTSNTARRLWRCRRQVGHGRRRRPRPVAVSEPAVPVASDGQPASMTPVARLSTVPPRRWTDPSVITRSALGLAPHGPDPWAPRDRDLAGDLEAVAAVEGEVPLVGGLQVGRHPLGVHAGREGGRQGRAHPL